MCYKQRLKEPFTWRALWDKGISRVTAGPMRQWNSKLHFCRGSSTILVPGGVCGQKVPWAGNVFTERTLGVGVVVDYISQWIPEPQKSRRRGQHYTSSCETPLRIPGNNSRTFWGLSKVFTAWRWNQGSANSALQTYLIRGTRRPNLWGPCRGGPSRWQGSFKASWKR